MLYPLSYEGLACTFAQHAVRVSVRWAPACYLVPDSLCRVPGGQLLTAAPARGPIVRLVVPGQGSEVKERRGTHGTMLGFLDELWSVWVLTGSVIFAART
jgi:hypothetical protein